MEHESLLSSEESSFAFSQNEVDVLYLLIGLAIQRSLFIDILITDNYELLAELYKYNPVRYNQVLGRSIKASSKPRRGPPLRGEALEQSDRITIILSNYKYDLNKNFID